MRQCALQFEPPLATRDRCCSCNTSGLSIRYSSRGGGAALLDEGRWREWGYRAGRKCCEFSISCCPRYFRRSGRGEEKMMDRWPHCELVGDIRL